MSYNIDFVNNKRYSADDINAIRTTIMTGGIVKKGDADCLVTLKSDGIHIASGEAIFNDGCRIELTEAEVIPHDGGDCYVYFDRNYYGEPMPDKGDALPENCIPLGQIAGGVVTDLRGFATLKVPTMAPNRYLAKELPLDFAYNASLKDTQEIVFEDRTDIDYITITHHMGRYYSHVLVDFKRDKSFGVCGDGRVQSGADRVTLYDLGVELNITKIGNRLIFDITSTGNLDYGPATVTAL